MLTVDQVQQFGIYNFQQLFSAASFTSSRVACNLIKIRVAQQSGHLIGTGVLPSVVPEPILISLVLTHGLHRQLDACPLKGLRFLLQFGAVKLIDYMLAL